MTNEQLAILLSSYATRLKAIVCDVELALPVEVTRMDEWWNGEERLDANLFGGLSQEGLESKGYELRSTGRALILEGMREFTSDLLRDASRLSADAPRLSADARSRISTRLGAGRKTS